MKRLLSAGSTPLQSARFLVLIAFLLALLGLLTILSATTPKAIQDGDTLHLFFIKQGIALVVAMFAFRIFSRLDYHRVVAWAPRLLLVTWIGLVLVLVVGTQKYGARRWIKVGFYSLQVSEVAKFAVIIFASHYAVVRSRVLEDFRGGFLPAAACLLVTVVLVAAEPDFGTSLFLIAIGFLVLFIGGMRLRHILTSALIALPPFLIFMLQNFGHVKKRLEVMSTGEVHPQVRMAMHAMGHGGVLGAALGQGRAQLRFLPFIESDFIFASVGEQLGLVGSLSVAVLFLFFFMHGLKIAFRARDKAGFLMAFGFTFMVVFQAAINMAVVTGLVPPKGIGLPFVSYGGSSLVMLSAALGVMWNIAVQGKNRAPRRAAKQTTAKRSRLIVPGLDV